LIFELITDDFTSDDDVDVVFLEAFEAGEGFGVLELFVD
jgi:hypothetical protein